MYWPGSMFQSTASWPPCLTLCLMSRRTSEVITQQSWENELAWNEGAVPSQSPELARQQWPPLPPAVIIWRLISLAISSQVSGLHVTSTPAFSDGLS